MRAAGLRVPGLAGETRHLGESVIKCPAPQSKRPC
jgi:hypothetical protein